MLKTKSEIQEKLEQAEKLLKNSTSDSKQWLSAVVGTLRWVLGIKITEEPKDPVSEG